MPDNRPPKGWAEPDKKGIVRFTIYGPRPLNWKPPTRDGFEMFFVGVNGDRFTTWSYKPVKS